MSGCHISNTKNPVITLCIQVYIYIYMHINVNGNL